MRADAKTAEWIELIGPKSADIEVFARDVLGIDLNPSQLRWFRSACTVEDGVPRFKSKINLHVAANQIGKTIGLAILILWATHNKVGVPRSQDDQRWRSAAFQWFHLAPTQQQAYLVLRDIRQIVDGTHAAQRRKSLLPVQLVDFHKIEDYDGFTMWNGAMVQFRTTDERAKALQGRRAAGISYDEAAFESYLKSVVNEVLLMRLIAFGGPLFLVSTPDGINDYYEIVAPVREEGDEVAPNVWVFEDTTLVWSTVADNVGYGLTQEGVDQMEAGLDETTREQQLRGAFLEPAEAFFTPASTVLDVFSDLPELQMPQVGRTYVAFWDTSAETDPVVAMVLDVTTLPYVGVYFKHYVKPPKVDQLLLEIASLHGLYNGASDNSGRSSRCLTGWDATGMGGVMMRQQLTHIRPSKPLSFSGANIKVNFLTNLRGALATRQVLLPKSWLRVQRELLNYRLDDKKIQQDCVMTLAGAAQLAFRGFSGEQSRPFALSGQVSHIRKWW